MKPTIKKASGKTMRVATIFTGAACAAALAPTAAIAAPLAPASGSLRSERCASGNKTWIHFRDDPFGSICWGFKGTWIGSRNGNHFSADYICGGNNTGSYAGYPAQGQDPFNSAEFGHGTTYAHLPWYGITRITYIQNYGWAGNDQCP